MHHLVADFGVAGSGKRDVAGEQEKRHRPQRIDVDPDIGSRRVDKPFGSYVARRAEDYLAGRFDGVRPCGLLHQTEIEHLDEIGNAAAFAENKVLRLDVAVDQAVPVGLGQ